MVCPRQAYFYSQTDIQAEGAIIMHGDFIIGGITAFLLLIYLIIAMLFPEKF
jgi:K+-transporting ATPase KdpF subunit